MTGVIKFFNRVKGYGFIRGDDGKEKTSGTFYSSDTGIDKAEKGEGGGFYDKDPNLQQWWPIPATTITNSQGSLKNDYGYN